MLTMQQDKPFEIMTHAEYQAAIHAKITGTWNLHNVAQEVLKQPLEFFTMLSSVAGVLGNKGQANYAAANTFLDSFASYRQSMGLRASSVDLGAIEGIGYFARHAGALENRFDRGLWTTINEAMLHKIMSYFIFQQSSTPLNASSSAQLIIGITYPLSAEDSSFADDPRFAYLFHSHGPGLSAAGGVATGDGGIDHAVKAFHTLVSAHADESTLAEAAMSLLQTQIARLLRLEVEVEPAKPIGVRVRLASRCRAAQLGTAESGCGFEHARCYKRELIGRLEQNLGLEAGGTAGQMRLREIICVEVSEISSA